MTLFTREQFLVAQILFFVNHTGWILVCHELYSYTQRKIVSNIFKPTYLPNMYMWTKNIEKLYYAKSLKIPYLTWQVFFQKSRKYLLVISESYCNISLGV